jgi:hypothetical protein
VKGYFCERNANAGQEGVICYTNSRGDITPIIAAHELGHWFNELIKRNGYPLNDPYHDLANEQLNNRAFPPTDVDITPGHLTNQVAISGNNGDDFANMYSMWVFDDWTDTAGNRERKEFMDNNTYAWILRMLNP